MLRRDRVREGANCSRTWCWGRLSSLPNWEAQRWGLNLVQSDSRAYRLDRITTQLRQGLGPDVVLEVGVCLK